MPSQPQQDEAPAIVTGALSLVMVHFAARLMDAARTAPLTREQAVQIQRAVIAQANVHVEGLPAAQDVDLQQQIHEAIEALTQAAIDKVWGKPN